MSISMVLRDEFFNLIRRADVPFVPPDASRESASCPVLWAVDPHGNAIMNRRQMRAMIGEIDQLLSNDDLTTAERSGLIAARSMGEEGAGRAHRYLWFIGD